MSTVVLDTITGKSTATTITIGSTPVVSSSANSMTIRGEGSAQTSIQQGLAKVWARYEQDGTNSILDSFNVSGLTDEGNGDATVSIANDMGNINYSPQVTMWYGSDTSTPLLGVCGLKRGHAPAAGSFRVQVSSTSWNNGAVGADVSGNFVAVFGDLA